MATDSVEQGTPIVPKRSEADRNRSAGNVLTLTIPISTALTEIIRLHGRRIVAIEMPAGWDAAAMTFLSGSDDAGLHGVFDDLGVEVSAAVAVDQIVAITGAKADAIACLDKLQLRSGNTATPVNQTAARTIKLLLK